jgi:oxygen-independent coproporphyrinogen-3 oxidase
MAGATSGAHLPASGGVIASVYIHAPFCARRCFYCDFAVQVRRTGDVDAWARALSAELDLLEAEGRISIAPVLETLYVGGGTPSLLGPTAMERIRGIIGPDRLEGPGLEWTSEANPESLTGEVAEAWRRAGLNRISLGVQSFQSEVLRWMGRLHGVQGARDAVQIARTAGVENVSIDLIFGLPPALDRDWRADLEAAVALGVPHISLYGLTAEETTPLGRRVREGAVRMPEDDRYREEYLEANRFLAAEGFHHYEVSNFALPGFESRHNQAYWDGSPYLGLGNSSHSFLPPLRRWNLRDWDAYLQSTLSGRLPVADAEIVEGEPERLERLWLGLRTSQGIPMAVLGTPEEGSLIARWESLGLAARVEDRLVLTPEGWLLLDRLAVELSEARPPGTAA